MTGQFKKSFKSVEAFSEAIMPAIMLSKEQKAQQTRNILIDKLKKFPFTVELKDRKVFIKKGVIEEYRQGKNVYTNVYRQKAPNTKSGKERFYYGISDRHLRTFCNKDEVLDILKDIVPSNVLEVIKAEY